MCEDGSIRQEIPIPFVQTENIAHVASGVRNQIKIKSGNGVTKIFSEFNGGNNESHILYLINCNTVIQDKDLKAVILGWSKTIEITLEEIEYHEIENPSSSPSLSIKLDKKKKPGEEKVT